LPCIVYFVFRLIIGSKIFVNIANFVEMPIS